MLLWRSQYVDIVTGTFTLFGCGFSYLLTVASVAIVTYFLCNEIHLPVISRELDRSLELDMVITLGEGLSGITIGEHTGFDFSTIFKMRSGDDVTIGLRSQ
jgi:hypothetical protein